MPTYDGIGSSVTHEIEVVGDVFISNVEGGSLSTQVPFEIFSNVSGLSPAPTDSRQLRLRVQPTTEASPDDSYVTDMGIQNTTDNYFFITAPQNTSNVGDQNTFVISTTSNVGIGTTDPTKTLEVVGDIKCQTLSASTITGASPLVIDSDETITINAPIAMPSDAPMSIGTMTVSNIFHSDQLTMSAHVAMGSDKTLTTSNIVANTGDNLLVSSNLEVGTSNLFVDTATGRVGIGTTTPFTKLTIGSSASGNGNVDEISFRSINNTAYQRIGYIQRIGFYGKDEYGNGTVLYGAIDCLYGDNIHYPTYPGHSSTNLVFRTNDRNGGQGYERMRLDYDGRLGIGTASPGAKLDIKASPLNHIGLLGSSSGRYIISTDANGVNMYFTHGSYSWGVWANAHHYDVYSASNFTGNRDLFLNFYSGGIVRLANYAVVTSDDRIKTNERYIENATETLLKLKPQIYDKGPSVGGGGKTRVESGLIVQDVYYDAPELRHLIHHDEDAEIPDEKPFVDDDPQNDPDYSMWGSKSPGLYYEGFIAYLIKSNQEQQALIESLEARIEALENSS
jgi:hypothetical protein